MGKISSVISRLLKKCEINLPDIRKNNELHEALRRLVTILFGVVLGVGLAKLNDLKSFYDPKAFVLYIAYLAVVLNWYGYHFGVIAGQAEENLLNYVIDCLLLIIYSFLINLDFKRYSDNDAFIIEWLLFAVMFLLYVMWEFIRLFQENCAIYRNSIKKAILMNITGVIFFVVILGIFFHFNEASYIYWYIALVIIFLVYYRIKIHKIYLLPHNPGEQKINDEAEAILITKAKAAAKNAMTKISQFRVGAAIRSNNGKIYTGCNIEFDNLSNTIHAEESAISALISDGGKSLTHIAVYTATDTLSFPCGLCRQSLFELGGSDLRVIACNDSKYEIKTMGELLPDGFRL